MATMYDVALSFAGEDRGYVEQTADTLRRRGAKVFYDRYEQATLWGKNLLEHFQAVYRSSTIVVIFASRHYAAKVWTNVERQAAQAHALEESHECVLPVRFDDTPLAGLLPTTGYVDARQLTPVEVATLILEKLSALTPSSLRPNDRDGIAQATPAHVLDEPLQAAIYLHGHITMLVRAGKWSYSGEFACPPEMLQAEMQYQECIDTVVKQIHAVQAEVGRVWPAATLGPFKLEPLPRQLAVERALDETATNVYHLRSLIPQIRRGLSEERLRRTTEYRDALNAINTLSTRALDLTRSFGEEPKVRSIIISKLLEPRRSTT
jgi:hypothetical protein